MKDRIIEERNIKLMAHASDWEEAIRISASLLVDSGYITEAYIQLTINAVKEFGPYIVLMPGLALAHCRPDESVLKTGISLVTLDVPVCFGSENDPVNIVLTLAAKDNQSHLEKLEKLAEILSDSEKFERIKRALKAADLAGIL